MRTVKKEAPKGTTHVAIGGDQYPFYRVTDREKVYLQWRPFGGICGWHSTICSPRNIVSIDDVPGDAMYADELGHYWHQSKSGAWHVYKEGCGFERAEPMLGSWMYSVTGDLSDFEVGADRTQSKYDHLVRACEVVATLHKTSGVTTAAVLDVETALSDLLAGM